MRERIVASGSYRIRVLTWGPPDGPAAILLPGMAASGQVYAPQIRLLRNLGYTVHAIELPGFGVGPSLQKEDARFPQLAAHVIAAVDALGIERAVFLGHSLGGGVALYVALARPSLVERLVLLAPAAVGRSLHWTYRLFALPLIGRALLRPYRRGSQLQLRSFLIGSLRRDDTDFVEALLRMDGRSALQTLSMRAIVGANAPRGWRRLVAALRPGGEQAEFSLGPRLAELRRIPMLGLWGGEDRVISAGDAHVLRAANPDAEIHVARGVGHMLPLEAPSWCGVHIARFVGRPAAARLRLAA